MRVQHKQYKNHDIRSSPFVRPHISPEQWKARINIAYPPHGPSQVIRELLDEKTFYASESEAHEAGFEYARQIIDGNPPDRGLER